MRFNGYTAIPAVFFLASFFEYSLAGTEKIDAKIDIVVTLAHGRTVSDSHIKAAYKKLTTFFELGPDKARLAVVQTQVAPRKYDNFPRVVMNLSADSTFYEKIVENFTSHLAKEAPGRTRHYYSFWGRTFDLIRARIFQNVGSRDRAKVVIFIMFHSSHPNEDNEKAKTLRDAGAWLYIVTKNDSTMSKRAIQLAGDPNRVVLRSANEMNSSSSMVNAMDNVVEAIHHDLCQWDSACRYVYEKRLLCQFESWIPYMNEVEQCGNCTHAAKACALDDCKKECDKRWPWEKGPCINMSGSKRQGPAPPRMENCPQWTGCPGSRERNINSAETTPDHGAKEAQKRKPRRPRINTLLLVIGTIFAIVGVILLCITVMAFATVAARRARGKRRDAPKIAPTKVKVDRRLSMGKGPAGTERGPWTEPQTVEAAVAADMSLGSRRFSPKVRNAKSIRGKSNANVDHRRTVMSRLESRRW